MTTPTASPLEEVAGDRLAAVRRVLAGAEQRLGIVRDVSMTEGESPFLPPSRMLPVSDDVAGLIPGGALRRGTVVSVEGSTSLVLALIARASREGSWVAILGLPNVGVVAAARRGIDLGRLALIPHPGAEAATIAAACLDGMDIVILGPRLALSDTDRRRLAARARERGTVMVSIGPHPATHVALRVIRSEWSGLGAGEGRLMARTVVVARSGRQVGVSEQIAVVLDGDASSLSRLGGTYTDKTAEARRILGVA
jgi:hypothetical protein